MFSFTQDFRKINYDSNYDVSSLCPPHLVCLLDFGPVLKMSLPSKTLKRAVLGIHALLYPFCLWAQWRGAILLYNICSRSCRPKYFLRPDKLRWDVYRAGWLLKLAEDESLCWRARIVDFSSEFRQKCEKEPTMGDSPLFIAQPQEQFSLLRAIARKRAHVEAIRHWVRGCLPRQLAWNLQRNGAMQSERCPLLGHVPKSHPSEPYRH